MYCVPTCTDAAVNNVIALIAATETSASEEALESYPGPSGASLLRRSLQIQALRGHMVVTSWFCESLMLR